MMCEDTVQVTECLVEQMIEQSQALFATDCWLAVSGRLLLVVADPACNHTDNYMTFA